MTTKERAERLVAGWEDSPPATRRSLARLVQKALEDERQKLLDEILSAVGEKRAEGKKVTATWSAARRQAGRWEEVRRRIRAAMDSQGATRSALARKMGIGPASVCQALNEPTALKPETVRKFARALGLTEADLDPGE